MLDLKIVNGLLVTGDGAPGQPGELGIRHGKITAINQTVSDDAQQVLDAAGKMVCPGFIDLHTHCLPGINENYLQSGVTTVVGGNCGFSPIDIKQIATDSINQCGLNLAMLVGHNSVRTTVMGNVDRAPSASELKEMCHLAAQAMADGAVGLSSGLTYVPGYYSKADEVTALVKAAAKDGAYYASHMRDEGAALLNSIQETVATAQAGGLPAHISHLKARGHYVWGKSQQVTQLLDDYLAQGIDLTQDQYPYTATCGRIHLLYPAWAQEGEVADRLARLADPKQRARLKEDLITYLIDIHAGDGERVVVSDAPDSALAGRSLADIAKSSGRNNQPPDLAEIIMEITERFPGLGDVYCVYHAMLEDDVKAIMKHKNTAIASDAWSPRPTEKRPHPRMFGTCPRVLGHYAREEQVFPMEEAVRKMTSLPARRLSLKDRGILAEGAWADITVFDPTTVIDRATYDNPKQYPIGFDYVIVNGQLTIAHGKYLDTLAGKFISGLTIG